MLNSVLPHPLLYLGYDTLCPDLIRLRRNCPFLLLKHHELNIFLLGTRVKLLLYLEVHVPPLIQVDIRETDLHLQFVLLQPLHLQQLPREMLEVHESLQIDKQSLKRLQAEGVVGRNEPRTVLHHLDNFLVGQGLTVLLLLVQDGQGELVF